MKWIENTTTTGADGTPQATVFITTTFVPWSSTVFITTTLIPLISTINRPKSTDTEDGGSGLVSSDWKPVTSIIVGIVIGGIALICLVIGGVLLQLRRDRMLAQTLPPELSEICHGEVIKEILTNARSLVVRERKWSYRQSRWRWNFRYLTAMQ